MSDAEFVMKAITGMNGFTPEEWATLRHSSHGSAERYIPFSSYGFLSALEDSGSAAAETGWMPQHLRLEDDQGRLMGALPCYLKNHSQGEYVFDHAWADAYRRAGGRYYPKLQACIPFTPATGPRLLVAEGQNRNAVSQALLAGYQSLTAQREASSAHITFCEPELVEQAKIAGFLHRTDQQFHFQNNNYRDFQDFLDSLASRKRKAIRKERERALSNGVEIEILTGADLTEDIWDIFYQFYMDTGNRKWGQPYLTRSFYSMISERIGDDIHLIMARRDGRYIAGAINFAGNDTLYGRHWGCIEDHPFLHFEVCYYQAIELAIRQKLKTVEAGAQGQHKLARGYVPITTHSVHYIAHPGLRRAVDDYLMHERDEVTKISDMLAEHAPYKKSNP